MENNLLLSNNLKNKPNLNFIVIDNFYENPIDVRNFAHNLDFEDHGFHPGKRTNISYLTNHYEKFKMYLKPFGCTDIISSSPYSGSFQYNVSNNRSWIHVDVTDGIPENYQGWAGIIFLTQDCPFSAGTGFFKFVDGTTCYKEIKLLDNYDNIKERCQNFNDWELVTNIGNVFNRLVLFNSNLLHMSMDYFGFDINDSRLIQLFFMGIKFSDESL
jgi:hypothetical protein